MKNSIIHLNSLGRVEIEVVDLQDVEIFAKLMESSNGDHGPTYSDDCSLNGSPCSAVTIIDITP